jgi:Radical SAM superfamily
VFEPLLQHRSLSLMPTFRCTAACEHCGTFSNPHNMKSLSISLMLSAIDQAVENGYKAIVFTGGEPTLAGDDLLCAIQRASSAGVTTRVVTNAWWATDDEAASRLALSLVRAGLREINFSTGDQHTRFVPLDNIFRACTAALQAGLRTICIMVEVVRDRTITEASITRHPTFKTLVARFPEARIYILESPWMPMSPSLPGAYPEGLTANSSNLGKFGGCDSCLNTTTVQADGKIAACCGLGMRGIPELQIGHIGSTTLADADKAAADDFLKRWIRVEGPVRILSWAATHNPKIQWENMYAHRCQACIRLYKDPAVRAVIREHHEEKFSDVLFKEWLLHHFEPTDAVIDAKQINEKADGTAKTTAQSYYDSF